MLKTARVMVLSSMILPIFVATAPISRSQQTNEAAHAPLPSQISAGKKVFISYAGEESNYLYSGGPGRLYNEFYTALKSWARYELVGSPAEADLIFEIRHTNPFVGADVSGAGGEFPVSSRSISDPQFRLVILDPGTRVALWTLIEHVGPARLQGNRDKNFNQALNYLVNDLRNIAGPPPLAASNSKK